MLLLLFLTASVLVIWAKQTGLGKVFSGTEQKGREERGSDVLRCHALASAGTDAPEGRGQGRWRVFANGTLAIARAGLEDRGQYLCTAANPHGTAQLLVTLSVVAYPPRIAGGRWQLLTAHSGKPVAVACRAEGRPPPTIAWVLANKTHVSDSSTGNNDVRVEPDGTLIIKEATVYDRGLYTCVARNPAGTDTLVVKLQVVAAPPAILEEKRERVEGTMGENLKLPCTVTGNPRPAVHWVLFDGTVVKPLQFVNGKLFLFANGTLHLSTIAPSDSGNYECIATSSTGSDRRVVTLVVEPGPVKGISGESLSLHCLSEGSPRPRTAWTLPGGSVLERPQLGRKHVLLENGTLLIRDASIHDRGDYVCRAHNNAGESSVTVPVVIVAYAPRITISSVTDGSAKRRGGTWGR
uniref:Immunoglobulin superfamily member 10 n=1 Tax=Otus sunia TaxID=257818 RepID=A0A8C8E7X2_9STRI